MAAAHFFMIDGLLRLCEILCINKISLENCVALYKHAKVCIRLTKKIMQKRIRKFTVLL